MELLQRSYAITQEVEEAIDNLADSASRESGRVRHVTKSEIVCKAVLAYQKGAKK